MKKKIVFTVCILFAVITLFPIPIKLKDGGTIEYRAILYKISNVHSIATTEEIEKGKMFNEGIIIEVLGLEIFNNVK